MFDEPFAYGDSILHRLDPQIRLIGASLCAVCLAILQTLPAATIGFVLAVALLLLGRPAFRPLWHRLAGVNIFILFLWVTVPPTMPGEVVAACGPFHISREGLELTLLVSLKSNAIVATFLALVATMDSATMGFAMEQLHIPAKLVFLFLFSYRYIHVIAHECRTLRTAAILRGFRPGTNRHTYQVISDILGMVFVRSYERSTRVYEAMILRGFTGKFQSVTTFRTCRRDFLFLLVILVCLAGILLLDVRPEVFHA